MPPRLASSALPRAICCTGLGFSGCCPSGGCYEQRFQDGLGIGKREPVAPGDTRRLTARHLQRFFQLLHNALLGIGLLQLIKDWPSDCGKWSQEVPNGITTSTRRSVHKKSREVHGCYTLKWLPCRSPWRHSAFSSLPGAR